MLYTLFFFFFFFFFQYKLDVYSEINNSPRRLKNVVKNNVKEKGEPSFRLVSTSKCNSKEKVDVWTFQNMNEITESLYLNYIYTAKNN